MISVRFVIQPMHFLHGNRLINRIKRPRFSDIFILHIRSDLCNEWLFYSVKYNIWDAKFFIAPHIGDFEGCLILWFLKIQLRKKIG